MIKARFRSKIFETGKGLAIKPPHIKVGHIDQTTNTLGQMAPLAANRTISKLVDVNGIFYLGEIETPIVCVCGGKKLIAEFEITF